VIRTLTQRPRATLVAIVIAGLVAGPLAYGTHNLAGGLATAAAFWVWGAFVMRSLAGATLYAVVVSLSEALLVSLRWGPLADVAGPGVVEGFAKGVAGSVLGGMIWELTENRTGGRRTVLGTSILLGLAFGFEGGAAPSVAVAVGALLGGPAGAFVGRRLRPVVLALFDIWLYVREMAAPAAGFMCGYVVIVMIFAGWYAAAAALDPIGSFKHDPEHGPLTFGDFIYFSIVTFSTVGFGDISPISTLTRSLVALEIFLGTLWLVIVFAAITAYLAPRFARLARQPRGVWGRLGGFDGPAVARPRRPARERREP
jgi:voltage-gated potassium channel Kch